MAVSLGSGAQPTTDWPPGIGVIADDAKRSSDRNRQQQAHTSPDPAPEQQRNRDGYGVESYAATNQLRRNKIQRHDVDTREHTGDQQKSTHRLELRQCDNERRNPGQNGT